MPQACIDEGGQDTEGAKAEALKQAVAVAPTDAGLAVAKADSTELDPAERGASESEDAWHILFYSQD